MPLAGPLSVTTATLAALVGWIVAGWRLSSSRTIRPPRREALSPDRAAQRFRVAIVCGWTGWLVAYAYTLWKCPFWVCGIGGEKLLVALAAPFPVGTATLAAVAGWIAAAVHQRRRDQPQPASAS